jgi:hypothetical protein
MPAVPIAHVRACRPPWRWSPRTRTAGAAERSPLVPRLLVRAARARGNPVGRRGPARGCGSSALPSVPGCAEAGEDASLDEPTLRGARRSSRTSAPRLAVGLGPRGDGIRLPVGPVDARNSHSAAPAARLVICSRAATDPHGARPGTAEVEVAWVRSATRVGAAAMQEPPPLHSQFKGCEPRPGLSTTAETPDE